MTHAFDILFLGMDPSVALADTARKRAAKLELSFHELISCRATVEIAAKHKRHGRPYSVRLEATLPGHVLTVEQVNTEDAYVALTAAFDSMKRRLEETVQRMHEQAQQAARAAWRTMLAADADATAG